MRVHGFFSILIALVTTTITGVELTLLSNTSDLVDVPGFLHAVLLWPCELLCIVHSAAAGKVLALKGPIVILPN